MISGVVLQAKVTPGIEGDQKGDVVLLTVLPWRLDTLGSEDPGHWEVKSGVPYEKVGPVLGPSHKPEETRPTLSSLMVGNLGNNKESSIFKKRAFLSLITDSATIYIKLS